MPNIDTYYAPGSASTVTPGGPAPGGPSDLENFYRQLLSRQASAAQGRPNLSGNIPYNLPAPQVRVAQPQQQYRSDAADPLEVAQRNDAMQELAYRKRLREIDLNPPQKYIDSRPGVIGGYIADTSLLPVSMRPGNAQIQHGPQDTARAQGQFDNDAAFNANLSAQRARTQNTNLPSNNAYYGRG